MRQAPGVCLGLEDQGASQLGRHRKPFNPWSLYWQLPSQRRLHCSPLKHYIYGAPFGPMGGASDALLHSPDSLLPQRSCRDSSAISLLVTSGCSLLQMVSFPSQTSWSQAYGREPSHLGSGWPDMPSSDGSRSKAGELDEACRQPLQHTCVECVCVCVCRQR